MQQVLRISRKIDYGLRAMLHLASVPASAVVPFREIARKMGVPEDFLAKIRGPHGGYALARPSSQINFLEIIEAIEGPVALNVCLDPDDACPRQPGCTLADVWREGQSKMLDVYRQANLAALAGRAADGGSPVQIGSSAPTS
jgi:Rrf2 family protein